MYILLISLLCIIICSILIGKATAVFSSCFSNTFCQFWIYAQISAILEMNGKSHSFCKRTKKWWTGKMKACIDCWRAIKTANTARRTMSICDRKNSNMSSLHQYIYTNLRYKNKIFHELIWTSTIKRHRFEINLYQKLQTILHQNFYNFILFKQIIL